MDKSWKAFERHCAGLLDTVRTPLSGGMSGHGTRSDTLHPKVFLEAKHTKGVKSAFFTLWENTKKLAKREGKIPAVAMRKKGTRVSTLTLPLELGMEALRLYLAYQNQPKLPLVDLGADKVVPPREPRKPEETRSVPPPPVPPSRKEYGER